MIFAYAILIGFLIGIGLEISENHRRFIRNPIIQIVGGFAFVQRSTQNTFTTLTVIVLFYASTLIISNSRKTYKDLLGETLGEIMIDFAEDFSILKD